METVEKFERERAGRCYSVIWESHLDESPDLSHLGEYVNAKDAAPNAIDRKAQGDMEHGQFQFFNPGGDPDYADQDYRRMERFGNDWQMLGLVVVVKDSHGHSIGTASVWGVESDSGEKYLRETFRQLTREALIEARKDHSIPAVTSVKAG